jgi:hypothetical protein
MQTPPGTPEGRSEGPKRRRLDSIASDASGDGAVFLGRAPPRPSTPEPTTWEMVPSGYQTQGPMVSKRSRNNSNVSEDGAVFLGQLISRPHTPQLTARRRVSSIGIQRPRPTYEEDAQPRSPMQRMIFLLEGRFIEGPWTGRQRREFWKGCTQALVFVLGFMMMMELNAPHRYPSRITVDIAERVPTADVNDAACVPAHQYPLSANGDNSIPDSMPAVVVPGSFGGLPEAIPLPSSPITPDSSIPNSPPTGIPASQIWTFNPSALSSAIPTWLHPLPLLSSIFTLLSGQIASQASSKVGKAVLNKGSAVLVSTPDIHIWDTVVKNQRDRAGILSALENVEEVSSSLHVQISDQLFAKKVGGEGTSTQEQISAIETLEALQMQLQKLKGHQYEIVRLVFSSKTSLPKAA